MQEPLLSLLSSNGETHSISKPLLKDQYVLDLAPPSLSQSNSPLIINEARKPSFINLIANLSIKKAKIIHRSRSAPSVLFTNMGVDFHEPSDHGPGSRSLVEQSKIDQIVTLASLALLILCLMPWMLSRSSIVCCHLEFFGLSSLSNTKTETFKKATSSVSISWSF